MVPAPSLAPAPDPGALHHHAPRSDVGVVLHDHGHRVRRLQHAADAHPAGQVDVLADLRARSDGGPGVHHRALVHVAADVDERGHEHDTGRDVGAPAGDGAGHHPHPVQPGLQRHPVVVAEVARLRLLHRQQPERQQDGPLGPLVHAGSRRSPGPARPPCACPRPARPPRRPPRARAATSSGLSSARAVPQLVDQRRERAVTGPGRCGLRLSHGEAAYRARRCRYRLMMCRRDVHGRCVPRRSRLSWWSWPPGRVSRLPTTSR